MKLVCEVTGVELYGSGEHLSINAAVRDENGQISGLSWLLNFNVPNNQRARNAYRVGRELHVEITAKQAR